MKKILYGLLVIFFSGAFFVSSTQFVEARSTSLDFYYYCANTSGQCDSYTTDLGYFIDALPFYYTDLRNFSHSNNYLVFDYGNMTFHVEYALLEYWFYKDGATDQIFTLVDLIPLDENQNGLHDDLEDYMDFFKDVEEWYTDTYGFDVFWDYSNKLDVYLDLNLEIQGQLGYFTPGVGNPYLKVFPLWSEIYYGDESAEGTIVHEMAHAVQYSYTEFENLLHNNFAEGMAVMFQSIHPRVNDDGYLDYLEYSSLQQPEISIFGETTNGDMAIYGSYLWYTFLREHYYGNLITSRLMAKYGELSVYSEYSSNPAYLSFFTAAEVLDDIGENIRDAYVNFAIQNYSKEDYFDGDEMLDVAILNSHSSATVSTQFIDDEAPNLFGSNYIEFDVDGKGGVMELVFTGNVDAEYYLTFLSVDGRDVDYDNIINRYVSFGETETIYVPNLSAYDKIVMIVSVVNTTGVGSIDDDYFTTYIYPYYYFSDRVRFTTNDLVADESLAGEVVEDWYLFGEGYYWNYTTVSNGSSGTNYYDYEEEITDVKSVDHFIVDDGDTEAEYQVFSNRIKLDEIEGENVNTTTVFSLEPFSEEVDWEAFPVYGLNTDDYRSLTVNCEQSYKGEASYYNLTGEVLEVSCDYYVVDRYGYYYQFDKTADYMKGIGMTHLNLTGYQDGENFYTRDSYLTDTNLASLEVGDIIDYSTIFTDLDSANKNFNAVIYLYKIGVIQGYSDGTFQPTKTVNRAELLKILIEGQGITPDEDVYKDCFPDVTDDWYAKYVCYAKEEGWVQGYPDNTFKPADTVNKVEAIKMLLNSQGLEVEEPSEAPYTDVTTDQWFASFVAKAKELGILEEEGDVFEPDGDMARGGICENLYRLLIR